MVACIEASDVSFGASWCSKNSRKSQAARQARTWCARATMIGNSSKEQARCKRFSAVWATWTTTCRRFGKKRFITFREKWQPIVGWFFATRKEKDQMCRWTKFQTGVQEKQIDCTSTFTQLTRKTRWNGSSNQGRGATGGSISPMDDFINLEDPDGNALCVVRKSGIKD